jgi:hypothetical protein
MRSVSAGKRTMMQRIQRLSSIESGLDVEHNILAAHVSDEARLLEQP